MKPTRRTLKRPRLSESHTLALPNALAVCILILIFYFNHTNAPRPVSSLLEQPPVSEFIQGSSRTHDAGIDQLSQQLQQSASFNEDPNSVWVGGSDDEGDLFKF